MSKQILNPKIFSRLKKKFPKKTENAIRVKLSKLSRKHHSTINAAAEIWGKEGGFSVWGLLNSEDRESLSDKSFQVVKIKQNNQKSKKKKITLFINYPTQNKFLIKHIDEINRAYTFQCYTATFILIRKVIENLIVEIIKIEFPGNSLQEKELYLNVHKGRILDLSELITNLRRKCGSFDPEKKKLVLRILQLAEQFKDDANDKTHSLYHISNKKELDDSTPQLVFDLITEYSKTSK